MFGGTIHHSVEEALETLFRPELLEKENKYMCNNCQSKQDALKGTRIENMPNYVTLYVNRFELDFETMQRKKVKGKMDFQENIDFSKYVNPELLKNNNQGSFYFKN